MKNKITIFTIILHLFINQVIAGNIEYNLTNAINRDDLEHVKELIEKGADVNQKQEPFNQAPIIISPLHGIDFIKLLLDNNANINTKDQDNTTAIINSCLYGNLETTKYLISKGADIHVVNNDGMSVLDAAKLSENRELISYIKTLVKE